MEKRLVRSKDNQIIAGICAGLANYFNVDPTLVRVVFALAILGFGAGPAGYLIAWIIMPAE